MIFTRDARERERSAPRFLFGKVPSILYETAVLRAQTFNQHQQQQQKKTQEFQIDRNRQTDSKPSILLFIYYFRFEGGIFFLLLLLFGNPNP
jgi:hypothetical protein